MAYHYQRSNGYGRDYSTSRPLREEPGPWRDRYVPTERDRRRYEDDRDVAYNRSERRYDAYDERRYRSLDRYGDRRYESRSDRHYEPRSDRHYEPRSDRHYETRPDRHYEPRHNEQPDRSFRPPSPHRQDRVPDRARGEPSSPKRTEPAPDLEPPPPPREPSPAYLALTALDPGHLAHPHDLRKLLILDLNGTLVFRSSYKPKTHRDSGPRLRASHPRPFLPAFRQYLFAPETMEWLDVMIWSSAQPHSVQGMVDRCFGDGEYSAAVDKGTRKSKLRAIWARDTLGLSQDQYKQKVQTVKDLDIVWSKLRPPSRTPSPASSRPSSNPSSPLKSSSPLPSSQPQPSSPTPVPASSVNATLHSARSTLLLDDSPLKAVLQPYNHVCLPEYDGNKRAKDLAIFTREKDMEGPQYESDNPDENRKRKRRAKKEKRRQERLAKGKSTEPVSEEEDEYDSTLLAVIGVLEEVKMQHNVAAWIRAGGLWGPNGPPTSEGDAEDERNPPDEQNVDETSEEVGTVELDGDGRDAAKRKRARHRGASAETDADPTPSGNDPVSSTSPTTAERSPEQPPPTKESNGGAEAKPLPMWFEHPPTVQYWVERGTAALAQMDIPVFHGIDR